MLPDVSSLMSANFVTNVILFAIGLLIGVGLGRAAKGLLLVVAGVVILTLLGVTVVGLLEVEDVWRVAGPFWNFLTNLSGLLSDYPALAAGLVIGLIVGLLR